jgi:hypothetical protein
MLRLQVFSTSWRFVPRCTVVALFHATDASRVLPPEFFHDNRPLGYYYSSHPFMSFLARRRWSWTPQISTSRLDSKVLWRLSLPYSIRIWPPLLGFFLFKVFFLLSLALKHIPEGLRGSSPYIIDQYLSPKWTNTGRNLRVSPQLKWLLSSIVRKRYLR